MNWAEADRYLQSISGRGIKPGLSRMRTLMAAMGNPERKFKAVHVTGTNGKGSVCAMLESVLRHSRIKTGLYTSPHLLHLTERIAVNGQKISPAAFGGWIGRIKSKAGRIEPDLTYFEIVTAAAFCYFAQRKVEIAIVEVGLGGRLDATNVLPPCEAAVITNIGLEHQSYLGNTIAKIAGEKAGIVKSNSACLTAAQGQALSVISRVCRKVGAEIRTGAGVNRSEARQAEKFCALKGKFQARNIGLVLQAVKVLRAKEWGISPSAVREGLKKTRWPGRFDLRRIKTGRRSIPVMLDGAHNPAAIVELVQSLRETAFGKKKTLLIFNCLQDKNVKEMIQILLKKLNLLRVFVPALNTPRGHSPSEIRAIFRSFGKAGLVRTFPSVSSLWKSVRNQPETKKAGWILATGSLYLIGESFKAAHLSHPKDAALLAEARSEI